MSPERRASLFFRLAEVRRSFADVHRQMPTAADSWRRGRCLLWCLREDMPVMWIGTAQVYGAQTTLWACGWCIRQLNNVVWNELLARDRTRLLSLTVVGTP